MHPFPADVIRSSFTLVEPRAEEIGRAFYARLFAHEPSVRSLFGSDIDAQAGRLMQMIAAAVRLLDRPAELESALHALGERHQRYGVTAAHYPLVGQALIDTLASSLGPAFDSEVRAAWRAFYGYVESTMQVGASFAADARVRVA
jgi:hemoglobin-like flavoprotein